MIGASEDLREPVERLLRSATFRSAPTSRRLLKYLADRSLAGDADQLKEYTIGVDAFGKDPGYDPREDSTVRIQVGRLRQKLAEYYAVEGKDDGVVLELPKGRMRLFCQPRPVLPAVQIEEETGQDKVLPSTRWRNVAVILGAMLICSIALGAWSYLRLAPMPQSWSAELQELWQPFVASGKPLIVSVGDPLFVQFQDKTLFRDPSIENWDQLRQSPRVKGAQGDSRAVHYYAAIGEVSAAFLLGQRLSPRQPAISVVKTSQLQWQQMADGNILLLGPPRFFVDRIGNMPVSLEITESPEGFRVVHPQPGEPSLYPYRDQAAFFSEDGMASVVVTHAPGPVGNTDIESFASNSTFGRLGAIGAFTDPVFARTLVTKMRGTSPRIPRYYQVLLTVRYKGGVPTETSYVLHRELIRRQ